MSKPTVPPLLGVAMVAAMLCAPGDAFAQVVTGAPLPIIGAPPAAELPRAFDSAELERILSPIALYPDPLLAQVLTAATFASEIPMAAQWVNQWRGRSAEQLVPMLATERVNWDPSVQALVAFPTVLQMMATSMPWTTELGEAFHVQRADVMDAVQRLRSKAAEYGYLNSTSQLRVERTPYISILPVNPAYVVVPYYDPIVVFASPRSHYYASSAIYLGFGVHLGLWYEPWGWRRSGFYWPSRYVIGGYPGWNRGRSYRDVGYRYDARRYGSRPPQGWDRGGDRARPRDSGRRDDDGDRNRGGNPGTTGRGTRDVSNTGRSAQPRVVQRVVERAPTREVQRSAPQTTPRGNSEPRVARRRD